MGNIEEMQVAHSYDSNIFNKESAKIIIPLLFERFNINSVVDVGCGIATWLAVFAEEGITDFIGIDSKYVDLSKLQIPEENFKVENLESFEPPKKRFDLCLSVEVAEHLSESVSDDFVKNLTKLSDVVLFSSAIPGQTGQHHVNLQWPLYWAKKFDRYGYRCSDFMRPIIRGNHNVNWWYQQNMLIFINANVQFDECIGNPECYVHPRQYEKVLERFMHLRYLARRSVAQKIKDRLGFGKGRI